MSRGGAVQETRTRPIRARASGVVIGQVQQNKRWHLEIRTFVLLAGTNVGAKFVQEFVGPKLVGMIGVEIRKKRIEVLAQHSLAWLHSAEQRHRPRPRT